MVPGEKRSIDEDIADFALQTTKSVFDAVA